MARKPDDWMPLVIGKYLANTTHLTRDQHGAYLLLSMAYWTNSGPLDDDDEGLAATCKATPKEWVRLRKVVVKFFEVRDGKWYHHFLDGKLEEARSFVEKKSKAGSKGAEKRWQNDGTGIAEPSVRHRQTDAPLPSPSSVKKEHHHQRARAQMLLERMCDAHKITLQADPQRFTWESQLCALMDDGFEDKEIIRGIEISRQKGKISMDYVAACVRNPPKEIGNDNREPSTISGPGARAKQSTTDKHLAGIADLIQERRAQSAG